MSDMEETEGTEGTENPVAPHRVIGTPPPSPRLLGSSPVPQEHETALDLVSDEEEFLDEHIEGLPPDDPRSVVHGKRAERVVVACFTLAFIAGCGFIASSCFSVSFEGSRYFCVGANCDQRRVSTDSFVPVSDRGI